MAPRILHTVFKFLALDTLTDFLNHLSSGLVPQEVQPFLAGAYLVGLSIKMVVSDQLLLGMCTEDLLENAYHHQFFLMPTFTSFLPNAPARAGWRGSCGACLETNNG